jgi:Fic family protein
MPIKFKPKYEITPSIMGYLLKIESLKEKVVHLPLTTQVLISLRETARLFTTHYSTMIEGNLLDPEQIAKVLKHEEHFPGRERDEKEVKGYYAAITELEKWVAKGSLVSEEKIKTLHSLVMGDGRSKNRPTPYRDGQNVIRDNRTKTIVYMPPVAKDVPFLMGAMVDWISGNTQIPCPIVAAISHYQFATIHPYYDGNGRTARLLTTLILHLGGYDLKGLYSLEEYYARNLGAYYEAISVGPSHNYYMGRADADITKWIEYFLGGMVVSFESIFNQMTKVSEIPDQSLKLKELDPKQRKALELFQEYTVVTAGQLGALFGFKPRTSALLCKTWVELGFLEVVNPSNKARSYMLGKKYQSII